MNKEMQTKPWKYYKHTTREWKWSAGNHSSYTSSNNKI